MNAPLLAAVSALLISLTFACGGGSGGSAPLPVSSWAAASLLDPYTGSSSSPQIGMDASGRILAVWEHDDGIAFHVLHSEYTPGQGWSLAKPLELEPQDDARFPQISMNADGFALAVWDQRSATTPYPHTVWASRYAPGFGWGAPERMDASTKHAFYPIVAIDKNGDGLALWKQENTVTSNADLYWCRFTASGGRSLPALLRADSCPGTGEYPGVAMALDGSGGGWAIWPDGLGDPILLGAHFAPSTGWTAPVILPPGSTKAEQPQIAMNDSGTTFALWSQYIASKWQLQTARYVPGSGWEPAQPLAVTTESQSQSRIAIQANGDAMAVWTQYPATQDRVKAMRYVAGTGWEAVKTLSADTLDDGEPTLAADGQGNWLAAWLHHTGAAPRSIEASLYKAGSGWASPTILSTAGTDALDPCPILRPGLKGAVIWNEYTAAQGKVWSSLLK